MDRGVEMYVCAGVLRWMSALGVLRGCVRWGVEGGVRWGVEGDVCTGGVEVDVCTGVLRGMCALGC